MIDNDINYNINDSGNRRSFDTGAVRDIVEGKGRCDLMPLQVLSDVICTEYKELSKILKHIGSFVDDPSVSNSSMLVLALREFSQFLEDTTDTDVPTILLELAKHYEYGAKKYGERNWEIGIPIHSYIDSSIRHLLKYYRGDKDERHDIAFVWNIVGALWTIQNKPELIDLK